MNVGIILYETTDPRMADFMDNLDRVNALAEATPGFVWRLTGEGNNATDIRPAQDPFFRLDVHRRDTELVSSTMSIADAPDAVSVFLHKFERYATCWF